MANYRVPEGVLAPFLPKGLALDTLHGAPCASLVGFLFHDTRVFGVGWPGYRDFEEVNLRFYVKRTIPDGTVRRGVVFVSEIVPLRLVTWVANTLYGERYRYAPMDHTLDLRSDTLEVEYRWTLGGRGHRIALTADAQPRAMAAGSDEEFIFEHYWGYAKRGSGTTEYQVEHPAWRVFPVREFALDLDAETHYGASFAPHLSGEPDSVFLAEGSAVQVRWGDRLRVTNGAG